MADENTGVDEQAAAAHGTEGDASTEDTSNDGAAEGDSGAAAGGGADKGSEGNDSNSSEEPPVRRSAKDFIIERKNKKIAKLEGKDDAADDAAQPNIRDVIREELAPITNTFAKSADETELQAAFTKFPDAKKMEKTIRKYMGNEAYARVPVEFIVRGLLQVNETARKAADDEARGSRQGGHTRRPAEVKPKTAWDLSDAEFEKSVSNLMSGKAQ